MEYCQGRFVGYGSDEAADGLCYMHVLEILFHPRSVRMIRTRVFLSNRTQVVRLPKAVALDDDGRQVAVVEEDRARVIATVGESWDGWFEGPDITADFLAERDQSTMQAREAI